MLEVSKLICKNLVWRLEKSKILPMIEVLKPTEEELYPFKEKVGKLVNYAAVKLLFKCFQVTVMVSFAIGKSIQAY